MAIMRSTSGYSDPAILDLPSWESLSGSSVRNRILTDVQRHNVNIFPELPESQILFYSATAFILADILVSSRSNVGVGED